jgi:hypothetical protein
MGAPPTPRESENSVCESLRTQIRRSESGRSKWDQRVPGVPPNAELQWALQVSNLGPPPCKGGALPLS